MFIPFFYVAYSRNGDAVKGSNRQNSISYYVNQKQNLQDLQNPQKEDSENPVIKNHNLNTILYLRYNFKA